MSKRPESVSTQSRDEMVCPNCYTKGLEAHPLKSQDYSGKYKIIKGTRCPNEACKYHTDTIPETKLSTQYSSSTLREVGEIVSSASPLSSSSSISDVLYVAGFAIFVVGFAANLLGLNPLSIIGIIDGPVQQPPGTQDSTLTQSIAVERPDGTPLNATLEIGNQRTETVSGERILRNLEPNQQIRVVPQGEYVVSSPVVVSKQGSIGNLSVQSQSNARGIMQRGQKVVFVAQTPVTREINSTVGESSAQTSLISPTVAGDNISVTLQPVESGENIRTRTIGDEETTITSPGVVSSSTVSVTGNVLTSPRSVSRTWSGSPQRFNLDGNLPAKKLSFVLSEESSVSERDITRQVSNGDSITVSASESGSFGNAQVTVFGGTAQTTQTKSGVWNGDDPVVTLSESAIPTELSVEVTGDVSATEKEFTGRITGNQETIRKESGGNLPPRDVTISFTGGDFDGDVVAREDFDVDAGKSSSPRDESELLTVQSAGNYSLEYDIASGRNSELYSFGYAVNGDNIESSPQKSESLFLERGDTVSVWAKATTKGQSTRDADTQSLEAFEVQSTDFSEKNLDTSGGTVEMSVTVTNPTDTRSRESVVLYKDGFRISSRDISLSPGEETVLFFDASFSEEGYHSVMINDEVTERIIVGDETELSGSVSGEATLTQVNGERRVAVDTTGNGQYDCRVSAVSGSCTIQQIDSDTISIPVAQLTTTEVSYTVEYTSRSGAKGTTVDIGGDGTVDAQKRGLLRESDSITVSTTARKTTVPIDIESANGGDVSYELTWNGEPTIAEPAIKLNGETVVSSGQNYTTEQTFEVGELQPGQNTVSFGAASGSYRAQVEWTEPQDESELPTVYIDGERMCEPSDYTQSGDCKIENPERYTLGTHAIRLEGNNLDGTQYEVVHEARVTPKTITVEINDQEILFNRQNADTIYQNGRWKASKQTNAVSIGKSTASISSRSPETELTASATGEVQLTFGTTAPQNPELVITGKENQVTKSIQQSRLSEDGTLDSQTTVEFSPENIPTGNITIGIQSDSGGVARLRAEFEDYPRNNTQR